MRKLSNPIALSLLLSMVLSCGPKNGVTERNSARKTQPSRISLLKAPGRPLTLTVGEEVHVQLTTPDTISLDSVQLFLGGNLKQTILAQPGEVMQGDLDFTVSTGGENTGKKGLRVRVFFPGGKSENHSQQITLLSDLVPVNYSYRIVNEYAHDPEAYTQGLQYNDGWLYEGTGNYGTSSLRRVNLETGEVSKIRNLDQSLFGEGITVFGDRIYQVTYKSQVGFIYDKSTFEEIQKVYYQNREGWGLTHNGEELIMSDGTNIIYFLDPEMFTINRQIEVYHNEGPAQSLNELEYINGKIWANRYYTDEIVIIDPETGKMEGRLNLKGILKTTNRKSTTDVLNGIAWDADKERLFVTGKLWPKLFEIKTAVQ
ncbi:MAG: glutaminyl-peptide cyclotransferase [Bacteroidota bacterium]